MDPTSREAGGEMTPLAAQLARSLGVTSLDDLTVADVEAALADAWTVGTSVWPGVVVEREPFVSYLAERIEPGRDLLAELRSLHVGDLYLACACAAGIPNAITAFEHAFFVPVDDVLVRMGMPIATIDEAKQLLRIQFFVADAGKRSRITSYAGRGDLKRWVHAAMVRTAFKLRRTPIAVTDDAILETLADARQDFELDFLKRTYRQAFEVALRDAFAMLAPRDRNLLRYYFVKRLSIDQLGVIYHVHRATAARRIRSVNEALVARTREILAGRLGIGPTDVSSILRLVQSQAERSLRSVLASA